MPYNKSLKKELVEMWNLVNSQHNKCFNALVNFDKDLAREIILIEERVNSSELLIDKQCENYISLQSSQPVNIPFVMLVLKINRQLERIGDNAAHIAKEVLEMRSAPQFEILHSSKVTELYKITLQMLNMTIGWFENGDMTHQQFLADIIKDFQETCSGSRQLLVAHINNNPHESAVAIHLFSIEKYLDSIMSHLEALMKEIIQKSSQPAWINHEMRPIARGFYQHS
jgi:phosphate transport system protein